MNKGILSNIYFLTEKESLHFSQKTQNFPSASFSFILAQAAYIVFNDQQLTPPGFNYDKPIRKRKDHHLGGPLLSICDLYEPWCDYLCDQLEAHRVVKEKDNVYFFAVVDENYMQKLKKSSLFEKMETQTFQTPLKNLQEISKFKIYEAIFKKALPEASELKIGIFSFATSQLRTDLFRPKVHLRGLFEGILYEQGDKWHTFNILKGEYPTEAELLSYDAFVLSGSSNSVNDQFEPVEKSIKMLHAALEKNQKLKLFGSCFGHQLITKFYNEKVIARPLVAKIQKIKPLPIAKNILGKYYQEEYQLFEYHGDNAIKPPKDFILLAQSPSCQNQMMIAPSGNILSSQFHFQYSIEYARSYQLRFQQYEVDDVLQNFGGEEKGKPTGNHHESIMNIRKFVTDFVHGRFRKEGLDELETTE